MLEQAELSENFTFYDILDIEPNASQQEIRDAYLRTKTTYQRDNIVLYSLISHEEREKMLKKIEEAYSILSDVDKRKKYDKNFDVLSAPKLDPTLVAKIVSIDRFPPMDAQDEADQLLIPPATDFEITQREVCIDPSQKGKSDLFTSSTQSPASAPLSDSSPLTLQQDQQWCGAFLKQRRDACKISLEEMADFTKITKTYLKALEDEDFKRLPAPVYVRGFIVQISKVLKLPYEKVAHGYMQRYHQKL